MLAAFNTTTTMSLMPIAFPLFMVLMHCSVSAKVGVASGGSTF